MGGIGCRVVLRRHLHQIATDHVDPRQPAQQRQRLARRQPAHFRRSRARREGRIERVDVEGDIDRARAHDLPCLCDDGAHAHPVDLLGVDATSPLSRRHSGSSLSRAPRNPDQTRPRRSPARRRSPQRDHGPALQARSRAPRTAQFTLRIPMHRFLQYLPLSTAFGDRKPTRTIARQGRRL